MARALFLYATLLGSLGVSSQVSAEVRGTYDMAAMACVGAPREICESSFIAGTIDEMSLEEVCALRKAAVYNALDSAEARATAGPFPATSISPRLALRPALLQLPGRPPTRSGSCRRSKLSPAPIWVSSAEWASNGQHLIITDLLSGALHFYSPGGTRIRSVNSFKGSPTIPLKPISLRATASGYMLENVLDDMLILNQDFSILRSVSLASPEAKSGARIATVYQWAPLGNLIFAFADIQKPDKSYTAAFLKIDPSAPHDFSIVHEMTANDPSLTPYFLGFPYVATIGGKAFFLALDGKPHIFRANSTRARLGALPQGFEWPTLPLPKGPASYREIFRVLERSAMPTGLYSWRNYLYVLLRQPTEQRTTWLLGKINPETGRLVDRLFQLPSYAPHITLVPGEQSWAVIERGTFEAPGRQKVLGMVLLSSSHVERGSIPEEQECE